MRKPFFLAALLAAAAGCQSYEIIQRNVFADEDGNVITVEYGRSDTDHVNTFINPQTQAEMEFRSPLVVRVHLPDGDSFTAWGCMNPPGINTGTMYKTDNEKWMFLANGFTAYVYRQTKENKTLYHERYKGVLCESPKTDYEPDDRWRKLKKDADGKWK